eukprot:gnl/Spiro4/23237_TR11479_c0_g1_i1.p1 gnl/Spiro4/23237_TR11479_c0_g1~~gnl/Spiro4/23237_TR11479_c0_g1_i1.p1  ORF type:complete len:249 (+),score=64.26 gnl/Spiro4/23237_TR11479_c0_g1_i1:38-748(+)
MGDRYAFSLTTFSPSGKLVQIEYALNAVSNGSTSLGIKATNGCVIATEKKFASTLMEVDSIKKMAMLSENIGAVYSGMSGDFRVLVKAARKKAQIYFRTYHELIPVTQLVREIATIMQEFTQSGGVRPFGASLLVIGMEEGGPRLFQVDPSGSFWGWKASAIGRRMVNAKNFLEMRYSETMELEDAIHTAIVTLKEGFEGQMTGDNIEIGIVGRDNPEFRILTPAEIRDYLAEADN